MRKSLSSWHRPVIRTVASAANRMLKSCATTSVVAGRPRWSGDVAAPEADQAHTKIRSNLNFSGTTRPEASGIQPTAPNIHRVGEACGKSALLAIALLMSGCGGGDKAALNEPPQGLRVMKTTVHGSDNDLLTGGVGVVALADTESPLPTYANPESPTAAELRRFAIARKFDTGAGEGVLWGTAFDPVTQKPVVGEGKLTGTESLAFYDDGTGTRNASMFVQIPDTFDVNNPCVLVVAPVSAARLHLDTYLVSWGLRRNCAVASSDKGGGNGVHDLSSNKVVMIDGTTADADSAGKDATYVAPDLKATDYSTKYPNRISAKYYGKRNRMAEQGEDMVAAAKFALFRLNEVFGEAIGDGRTAVRYTKANTTIIIAGRSSGGGGAVKAMEVDTEGYFDGAVVLFPAVQPVRNDLVSVQRGGRTIQSSGVSSPDFLFMESTYMICAGRAEPNWPGYANLTYGDNMCASLKDKGLVSGDTTVDQARDAVRILDEYGFDPDSHWQFPANGDVIGPMHAMAATYMRVGVERVLCGVNAALTVDAQGRPTKPTRTQLAQMWVNTGTYNPQPIYEDSLGGAVHITRGISPSTGRLDGSLDAKLCLQALKNGTSTESEKYRSGEQAAANSGNLHGKPMLLIAAREDVRLPATLTSRMYLGLNSVVEGSRSKLRYIEMTNSSHTNPAPARISSPDYYLYSGLNIMWDHLRSGKPLPPNQVIRTLPRGENSDGSAKNLAAANVPPPSLQPVQSDIILVDKGAVVIPD